MERKFDGGMAQPIQPIKTGHEYSKPTYNAGETVQGTGSHATEPIRPITNPNKTVPNMNVTRISGKGSY